MQSDTQRHPSGASALLIVLILAAVALVVGWLLTGDGDAPQPTRPSTELAYLNLGPEATYVGSDTCKTCHQDQHEPYVETPHGRSMGDVDAAALDLPGLIEHQPSGLIYRIEAAQDGVRVRELLALKGGGQEVLNDRMLAYALGSGTPGSGDHVQCFLTEIDGFLVQAPVAWANGKWVMAPGYDAPLNAGFARPVSRSCLACHGGRAASLEQSLHRIQFHEKAISCERCHGPASLHVELQEQAAPEARSMPSSPRAPDLTIVNPARLTREGSLQVCAQCHVDEGMTIQRTGHNVLDWRPGLRMSDYRITYRPRTTSGDVPVVGRVEQLRASACFQASPDMGCTTCHDAHMRPAAAERAAYFAAKCATCHEDDSCGLSAEARHQTEGGDDCTSCHMPRAEERSVHQVFTNHRVGLHRPQDVQPSLEVGEQLELVLREDVPGRSEAEGERDLAIAMLRLPLWRPGGPRSRSLLSPSARQKAAKTARRGLSKAETAGTLDADGAVALSTLDSRQRTKDARERLEAALAGKQFLREETRIQAMALLSRALFELGHRAEALKMVNQLTRARRSRDDWELVVAMARESQDQAAVLRALAQILEIAPQMESSHYLAAEIYEQMGEAERARHHQRLALQLARHLADERAKAQRESSRK